MYFVKIKNELNLNVILKSDFEIMSTTNTIVKDFMHKINPQYMEIDFSKFQTFFTKLSLLFHIAYV